MLKNKKFIDLHTHSVMSDGSMTPAELVRRAKAQGLAAIALTDHDSIDGVHEAMEEGEKIGVEVVPAVELSAISDTELHILGYYIDIENPFFLSQIERALVVRRQRTLATCENLIKLGFDVTVEEAVAIAPAGIVGRAHFARLLANKGYTSSVKEAFDLYLNYGKPAYSNTQCLTAFECVEMIKKAGGVSFVAHLHLTKMDDAVLKTFLQELIGYGLDGIEGYYTDYTPEQKDKYQALAKRLDLGISGGTDFHGAMKPHIEIGTGLGNLKIPYSVLENIRALLNK